MKTLLQSKKAGSTNARRWLAAGLIALAGIAHAADGCVEAGWVQYAEQTTLYRDGATLTPVQGGPLCQGDRIVTGSGGEFHGKLADGGYVALSAGTEFRIDKFRGGDTDDDAVGLTLVRGALRTMSGWISKLRPRAFSLTAPTATIGVRGTDFEVYVGDNGEAVTTVNEGEIEARRDGHVLGVRAGRHAMLPQKGNFRMLSKLPPHVRSLRQTAFRQRALIEAHRQDIARHIREALERSPHIRKERREAILQLVREKRAAIQSARNAHGPRHGGPRWRGPGEAPSAAGPAPHKEFPPGERREALKERRAEVQKMRQERMEAREAARDRPD